MNFHGTINAVQTDIGSNTLISILSFYTEDKTMIYSCPNCMAALIFNPTKGKLDCLSCGSEFEVNQFEQQEAQAEEAATKETAALKQDGIADDFMECQIYSCTACGAELAVNGVETSTFCSYCGQPTIVFNRVADAKRPHYIIPFTVTKEKAVTLIRKHLQGFFVPKEIQNFSIERIRGIYIPYWLYDIDYSDRMYLKGTVKSGKYSSTRYYYRAAKTYFRRLTLDGSEQLHDESSQRLEPYYTDKMVPFETSYLSGFYADCFDMNNKQLERLALDRARQLFNQEVIKTVRANSVSVIKCQPQATFQNVSYAMFPAWFLTFRYNNEPYTILVNGQTEKVVGAVPSNRMKMQAIFWITGILASILSIPLAQIAFGLEDSDGISMLLALGAFAWINGYRNFKKVKKSIDLSKSTRINHFVKDRQEG